MPPVRGPQNAKGLKTERTHEENQERAYIAASRRSDRSLEARIESARRASEIHKKRTGRALRVTEQDVINEEMYEEEDDDLQSQYRRLQAHLGNSADLFNGRLSAWVLSHYGTRQMAMAAQNGMPFNPGLNMQPPATPFFAYQPQPQSPTTTLAPDMTQRSQSYRQSPYPQQYHRMPDQRSHSLASIPQEQHLHQGMNDGDMHMLQNQRRHSLATPPDAQSVPGTPQSQADVNRPPMSRTNSNTNLQPGHLGHAGFYNNQQFAAEMFSPQFNYGFPQVTSSFDPLMHQMQSPISPTTNPLTVTLPPETQQIIGNQFEQNNPYNQMLMNMSHGQPIPQGINYTYRPNAGTSTMKSEGINQTLSPNPMVGAPVRIETNVDNLPTPALTHGSMSSNDQLNAQYVAAGSFDTSFGLGMDFPGNETPGDLTTTNTPPGLFDYVQETTDEVTQS